MKKLLLAVLACAVLLLACTKKAEQEEEAPVAQEINACVIRVDTGFFVDGDMSTGTEKDTVKWKRSLPLGELVILLSEEPVKLTYDKEVTSFVKIRTDDGTVGYASPYRIAGGELGVVVDEKAAIYKSAKNVDVTGSILPRKTVLAYDLSAESGGFIPYRAFDDVKKEYSSGFLRTGAISNNHNDVQACVLYSVAQSVDTKTEAGRNRRNALLNSILDDYSGSFIEHEVEALLNKNETDNQE